MVSFDKDKFIKVLGFQIANELAKNAPKKSGNLARSFTGTFRVDGEAMVFELPKYWQSVEFGASPHIIRPKNKKALFFKGLKHPVKLIHHPGNKPNPFTRNTINNISEDLVEKALKAALK